MSSWAKSGWTSRGRGDRHGQKRDRSGNTAANIAGASTDEGPAAGGSQKESQDLRVSRSSTARDRGGVLQFQRQEIPFPTSHKGAATAADASGQHRQQRAGPEKPSSGG